MPIGFGCLTSAVFSMRATILRQGVTVGNYNPQDTTAEPKRNPITGEIIRDWTQLDNPDTDGTDESKGFEFPCLANAIANGGLNSQGAAERWTSKGEYDLNDYVELKFPSNIDITSRDRITDIKDATGKIIWLNEEYSLSKDVDGNTVTYHPPTIFDVSGVMPEVDPFGRVVWNYALINKAAVTDV